MKTITPPATAAAGDIRAALAALAKVVKKSVPPGAAQQHVRVDPVGRKLFRLTGTGHGTFFTAEIPGEAPAKFDPFLVPIARLKDLIRGAKAHDPVALHPGKAPPASEFPATPKFRTAPMELREEVTSAILRAFACASTDETRRILQGAYFDVGATGGCRIVGTDGRHLFASRPLDIPGLKDPVILPSLKVFGSPLVKGAPGWNLRVATSANGSGGRLFRITGDGWSITGHLAEGNYPAYRQVIPPDREFKTRLALPPQSIPDIVHALGRMPGSLTQNRPVGIRIGNGTVSLLTREDEKSAFEEIIIPARADGKPTTVFLNRDYFAKALSFGMSEIAMADAISPVKLTGEGGLMIVMPVRVQEEIEVCRSDDLGGKPRWRQQPPRRKPTPNPAPAKRKPGQKGEPVPEQAPPKPTPNGGNEHNPMDAAAGQIAAAKDALRAAMSAVNDIAATLKATRQKQRQSEKEFRSVRHTLRSLRKVDL